MTAAKRKNIASPNDAKSVYGRFIPREELNGFAAWTPGSLHDRRAPAAAPAEPPPPPPGPTPQQQAEVLRTARQSGYQDGYRDGLAALEAFKQSYAATLTAQLGALLESHHAQLGALQQDMARALAGCATALARQMVRSELATHPERVVEVARQAVDALLLSASHITLRVHPDDLPLVAEGATEVLAARGARLVADASLTRGGCRVDSDIGGVDASIETRWKHSAAAIGAESVWIDNARSA